MEPLRAYLAQLWTYWTSDALSFSTPAEETAVLARKLHRCFHHDTRSCILPVHELVFEESIALLRNAGWEIQLYVDEAGDCYYLIGLGLDMRVPEKKFVLPERYQLAFKNMLNKHIFPLFSPEGMI